MLQDSKFTLIFRYVGFTAKGISEHHGSNKKEVWFGFIEFNHNWGPSLKATWHMPRKNQKQQAGIESFQKLINPYLWCKMSTQIKSSQFLYLKRFFTINDCFVRRRFLKARPPLGLQSVRSSQETAWMPFRLPPLYQKKSLIILLISWKMES